MPASEEVGPPWIACLRSVERAWHSYASARSRSDRTDPTIGVPPGRIPEPYVGPGVIAVYDGSWQWVDLPALTEHVHATFERGGRWTRGTTSDPVVVPLGNGLDDGATVASP